MSTLSAEKGNRQGARDARVLGWVVAVRKVACRASFAGSDGGLFSETTIIQNFSNSQHDKPLCPSAQPTPKPWRPWRPGGFVERCARRLTVVMLVMTATACRNEMYDQAKVKPLSEGEFFANGQNARPIPPDTVARGFLREDKAMYAGLGPDGKFVKDLPLPLTRQLMERGHERFDIFCSPCHGKQGNGLGMIVERGFKQPNSFHPDRLREQPIGYFFDVMTHGFGAMQDYASQVPVADRWAIAAYIRALQLSQNATVDDVPPAARPALEGAR